MILTACSEPATLQPASETAEVQLPQATELNQTLKTLARATSRLVGEPEFRVWLKAEALKQFDGDYDVLWQHHLDHQFPDGQTLRAKLVNALAEQYDSPQAAADQFDRWMAAYPVMQFAVPVHLEDWEAEVAPIPVAYLAEDFEDSAVTHIDAFFGDEKLNIATTEDPNFSVIVVGLNERTKVDGTLRDEILQMLERTTVTHKMYRDNLDEERLKQVYITSWSGIEGWLAGAPEFKLISVFGNGAVSSDFLPFRARSDFNGQWVVHNYRTVNTWDWSVQSTQYTQQWIEEDGGNLFNIEITAGIPSIVDITLDVPIRDNDDDLGQEIIDAVNHTCWEHYNTGKIRWYMECED